MKLLHTLRILLVLAALLPWQALAQNVGSPGPISAPGGGGGGGCPTTGCTFSGPVNTTNAAGYQINGVSQLVPVPGGAGLQTTISTDLADALNAPNTRYNMHQTTLSVSVNTNNIWENDNSFVFLNGPAIAQKEINIKHSYFQNNAGATAAQVEAFEGSMLNAGSMGSYVNYLGIMNNTATGVVTNGLTNISLSYLNDNTTPGAIPLYVSIACGLPSGVGAPPTTSYCLRNADPAQTIATAGGVVIGGLGVVPAATQLFIQGPDALATTFPIKVNNQGNIAFSVNDAGTVTALQNLTAGKNGTFGGTLSLFGATAGQIKLQTSGSLAGPQTLTPPATTDTVAVLGTSQTHTATQTFSGTANFSGVLQGNGVAGVSCAANSVTLLTEVVTNGIITHC